MGKHGLADNQTVYLDEAFKNCGQQEPLKPASSQMRFIHVNDTAIA